MASKIERQRLIRQTLLASELPFALEQLVTLTGANKQAVLRDLKEIAAQRVGHGVYTMYPTPEDVRLAHAILRKAAQTLQQRRLEEGASDALEAALLGLPPMADED